MVRRDQGVGKMGDVIQSVQNFIYKLSSGDLMSGMVTIVNDNE